MDYSRGNSLHCLLLLILLWFDVSCLRCQILDLLSILYNRWIVNPGNEEVGPSGYYLPESKVVQRVPHLFFTLGCIYACLMLIGFSLISEPPKDEEYDEVISTELVNVGTAGTGLLLTNLPGTYGSESELSPDAHKGSGKVEPTSIGVLGELTPQQLIRSSYSWHLSSCYCMTVVGGMYLSGQVNIAH